MYSKSVARQVLYPHRRELTNSASTHLRLAIWEGFEPPFTLGVRVAHEDSAIMLHGCTKDHTLCIDSKSVACQVPSQARIETSEDFETLFVSFPCTNSYRGGSD